MRNKLGRFIKGHHPENEFKKGIPNKGSKGEKNHKWKGGKIKNYRGYILILRPDHPFLNWKNYVLEHRLVMEKHIGRYLLPKEVVHHVNGIRDDNRIENLMLFKNDSDHKKYHFPKS